jgi:hypothetical protein
MMIARRRARATRALRIVDACGQHDEGREMGDHGFVSTKQKASSRREDVAAAGVETTPGARSFAIRLDLEAQ